MNKLNLIGLTKNEISQKLTSLQIQEFRAQQIIDWIYKKCTFDFNLMTNLSKDVKDKLANAFVIGKSKILNKQISSDGTIKYLIELEDSETVECVKIIHLKHETLCISSQVGCPLKCTFCATGTKGFVRNLRVDEIIEQFLLVKKDNPNSFNIVFMGMGEPLLNLNNVIKAIEILTKEIGISKRNITVSTIGIIPGIKRLINSNLNLELAISLHAPNQNLREQIIPYSSKYPYYELINLCKEYADKTKRRITFEYVMLKNFNDTKECAIELVKVLKGVHCHINLIPFNPINGIKFAPSPKNNIKLFKSILENYGFTVTVRKSFGQDIDAACGQLWNKKNETNYY